jgi:hypothetical protein
MTFLAIDLPFIQNPIIEIILRARSVTIRVIIYYHITHILSQLAIIQRFRNNL